MLFTATFFKVTGETQWTGTIPSEIGLLTTSLKRLEIFNANLDVGSGIPPDLYKLTKLTSLIISNCESLGGTLSTNIGKLSYLEMLDISNNQMTGIIPLNELMTLLQQDLDAVKILEGNKFELNVTSYYMTSPANDVNEEQPFKGLLQLLN